MDAERDCVHPVALLMLRRLLGPDLTVCADVLCLAFAAFCYDSSLDRTFTTEVEVLGDVRDWVDAVGSWAFAFFLRRQDSLSMCRDRSVTA